MSNVAEGKGQGMLNFRASPPSSLKSAHSARLLCALLLLLNLPAMLYTGLVHQRGPLDVMAFLRQQLPVDAHGGTNATAVLFLTPCHATPLYRCGG